MRFGPIIVTSVLVIGCSQPAAPPTAKSGTSTTVDENQEPSVASPRDGTDAAPDDPIGRAAETVSSDSKKPGESTGPSDAPTKDRKEPARTAGELIAQAREVAAVALRNPNQSENLDEAIKLLQQALEQAPKNAGALGLITECTQMQGMQLAKMGIEEKAYDLFLKSGEYARRWREAGTPLSDQEKQLTAVVYYNEACALALTKQPDKAIESLAAALDAGFNDLNQLDKDSDLNSLRDRDDYKKLREQAVERSQGVKGNDK